MSLFHATSTETPHLNRILPPAAMPGGELELQGTHLDPAGSRLPHASIGDIFAPVLFSRPDRATVLVPDGSISGDLVLHRNGEASNPLQVHIAVPMAENLHPVANPVVDANGQVFTTLSGSRGQATPVFVFATLEPSVSAYHLAFNAAGTLLVTGPTTSSNQAIHAIDRDGNISVFFQGLGRAQGMAFDVDDNLYVAASLQGQRGIVRITPSRQATFAVSGNNLVGLTFVEDGCAVLATRDALYHVALDIEGRSLID
jgi:hypothetical protein